MVCGVVYAMICAKTHGMAKFCRFLQKAIQTFNKQFNAFNKHLNGRCKMSDQNQDYLNLVVYQIYPRSFFDSNSDGIGDLNGIKQKIPHLKELGINAVWICPCYKSPNYDNG